MITVVQRLGLALPILTFSCLQLLASPTPQINTPDLAVKKALPLLQKSSISWFTGAKCSSCHHQSLAQVTFAVAREQGFKVDEQKSKELNDRIVSRRLMRLYCNFEGTGSINGAAGNSYDLFGWSAANLPANDTTDAEAYYILSKQSVNGSWPSLSRRPPIEDSPFTLTALSARALQLYSPPGLKIESNRALLLARSWLVAAKPKTSEEMTFKLLGLKWSGAPPTETLKVTKQIIEKQNADGGWSQLPSMKSDAYATGQILVAIQTAGELRSTHEAVRKGTHYLVNSQKDDGSWLVETRRRFPGLPYFETGFPHREHQFISFAGTAWSTMALAIHRAPGWQRTILSTQQMPRGFKSLPLTKNAKDDRLMRAALLGSLSDVQRAIKAGANVNAVGPEGATALMYGARDAKKVALLLSQGAKVNAVSTEKTTAFHVACGFVSGMESMRLLVKAGAKVDLVNGQGETPLALAVNSGDMDRAKFLLENGANPNTEMAIAGVSALTVSNAPMLKLLINRGLDIKMIVSPMGHTLLMFCSMDGSEEIVNLLLESGANPNGATPDGLTVLMMAAMHDPGHSRVIESLIRHGANVDAKSPEGKTALSLATKYGNLHLAKAIENR